MELNYNRNFGPVSVMLGLAAILFCASAAFAQGTAFTYQGRLTDGGTPATGNYDLRFALFDSLSSGTQIGATQTVSTVPVSAGIFTVQLDFGAGAFPGANRWLEINARLNGVASFTPLTPRQPISSTPYAVRALSAGTAENLTTTASGNFIQNTTAPQASANFNISGNGIIGGNVGIGTFNPLQSKLEVNGEVAITPGGSGGGVFFAAPNGETGMLIRGSSRADIRFDGSTLKLLAGTSTGAPISTNGIAISTSGNVGIGTTNPTDKLTVQTATGNYGFVHTDGNITVGSFVGGSTGGGWYGTRSNHSLSFFVANGGPSMTIATNGNVGIGGTTGLGFKLYVNGGAMVQGEVLLTPSSAGGSALCYVDSGTVPGAIFISKCASSLRYKKDVARFTVGLDIVNRLRPIAFTWKDHPERDLGLAAEDVAAVEPRLVTYNQKGQVEGVKYDRLTAVLVNAIKQQQQQIETLQKTNAALSVRLRAVEKHLRKRVGSARRRR